MTRVFEMLLILSVVGLAAYWVQRTPEYRDAVRAQAAATAPPGSAEAGTEPEEAKEAEAAEPEVEVSGNSVAPHAVAAATEPAVRPMEAEVPALPPGLDSDPDIAAIQIWERSQSKEATP